MKTATARRLACGVLVALASVHAWSQTSETSAASNGSAMAASGAATAKATRQANRALRRKVYAAIVKHKEIDAGNISVVAKGSVVTLDGTVVDASQIDKVTEIAKGVPGVMSVTNRLTVKKPFGGQ
ncbi:BON domain-containing protein [Paraburkholderia sediminicola]|uniref:BON domain-containing protein n=1 Tax=Paraburkholderia sediminicola TaxID=458836 RepID=UPI0038BD4C0A